MAVQGSGWLGASALSLAFVCAGCADPSEPYRLAESYHLERLTPMDDGPQVERGRPNAILDGLNHYFFSLPTKLILWEWHVDDHELPPESEELLTAYLDANRLSTVKVRHNQYAPGAEWQRLTSNRDVGAGYRYTLGVLGWLHYTLLPGRLFAGFPILGAGEYFNPFTNTIHVYSSDPGILLHEAAHAKDYVPHQWRGTGFVLGRAVPLVDLLQEGTATADAIHFLQCQGEFGDELDAYRTLWPAYGTYVGSYLARAAIIPAAIVGHVAGRVKASARSKEIASDVAAPLPYCKGESR
jgi:hypothetical protein